LREAKLLGLLQGFRDRGVAVFRERAGHVSRIQHSLRRIANIPIVVGRALPGRCQHELVDAIDPAEQT
jgi:hypothetical protein